MHCKEPPSPFVEAGKKAFSCLKKAYGQTSASPIDYARIDLIESGEEFYLSEVELIEPELFFLTDQLNHLLQMRKHSKNSYAPLKNCYFREECAIIKKLRITIS